MFLDTFINLTWTDGHPDLKIDQMCIRATRTQNKIFLSTYECTSIAEFICMPNEFSNTPTSSTSVDTGNTSTTSVDKYTYVTKNMTMTATNGPEELHSSSQTPSTNMSNMQSKSKGGYSITT